MNGVSALTALAIGGSRAATDIEFGFGTGDSYGPIEAPAGMASAT
jgi:hypothetical protein